MTTPRVLAYTITRATTTKRGRSLLDTLTKGRDMAGRDVTWHVWCNGSPIAEDICGALLETKVIDAVHHSPVNVGQHVPTNHYIKRAMDEGYDYLLRTDDDVEWLTKRWLARLVDSSKALGDKYVLSPKVLGLRWQPNQTPEVLINDVPLCYVSGVIGGICRLIPVQLLRDKPYVSDVRLPMGGGDASGVGRWCMRQPIIPMAYLQHVKVRHAKTTDGQEEDDPLYHKSHDLFQFVPHVPAWRRLCE